MLWKWFFFFNSSNPATWQSVCVCVCVWFTWLWLMLVCCKVWMDEELKWICALVCIYVCRGHCLPISAAVTTASVSGAPELSFLAADDDDEVDVTDHVQPSLPIAASAVVVPTASHPLPLSMADHTVRPHTVVFTRATSEAWIWIGSWRRECCCLGRVSDRVIDSLFGLCVYDSLSMRVCLCVCVCVSVCLCVCVSVCLCVCVCVAVTRLAALVWPSRRRIC